MKITVLSVDTDKAVTESDIASSICRMLGTGTVKTVIKNSSIF